MVTGPPGLPGAALERVREVLDTLTTTVESARSMPMSASCVVNRAEVLALVAELRERLPEALQQAHHVLGDRAAVVQDGRREAERVIASAADERSRLLADTDVVREAETQSLRIVEEAIESAEATRAEVEDYVDARLANFEIVLTKTLEAVERGRRKLAGQHELDALRHPDPDEPPLPG